MNNVSNNSVTDNVVPNSPILVTLMTRAIRSSQTSVLTRATPCNTLEDDILYATDGLKTLHNELHSLYSSPNIISIMK
jgi:hypothetical protein